MKSIQDALMWRYATKKFDTTKKLTEEQVNSLLDAARLSPSWFGLQPWKFILVENPELREKLKGASYGQPQVTDASHFVVFAAKTDYTEVDVDAFIRSTAQAQNVTPETLAGLKGAIMRGFIANHKDNLAPWAMNQTHIALGVFLEAAALSSIDATPMGGFDPNAYDEILGLKELGLHTAVVCAIGYRSADDEAATKAKSRFSFEEVVIRK
jgi:nitroreductase/dihydropteridine reductase